MKKLITLTIAIAILSSMCLPAYAKETLPDEVLFRADEMPVYIDAIPVTVESVDIERKIELISAIKNNGYLSVTPDGYIELSEDIGLLTDDDALIEDIRSDYEFANSAIDDGLLVIDPATLELSNCDLTTETLRKMQENDKEDNKSSALVRQFSSDTTSLMRASHCSNRTFYLSGCVVKNRATITSFYNNAVKLQRTNPNIYPGAVTISFWIGKIQEGGVWDYKRPSVLGPYDTIYCCTYGYRDSKVNAHRTAEFIGNYNYGYTGRDLFSLAILKKGSDFASRHFFTADVGDYPAIEEGFADAGQ